MDPMFSEENRLASFKPAGSSRRRQTKAEPSMPQWPHPLTTRKDKSLSIPTPDSLAKYGFYFAPSDEHSDRTVHFLHDASVTGWKAGDNPLDRLEQQMPGNAWSMIWRSQQSGQEQQNQDGSKQWIWSSEELIPNGKQMCQARKETFATQWPYDGKKGWKPTSKKLADAGFHFTPTEDEPDSATCIYCNKGLGGWEKGDDPIHEHKKREPDCAFFNCVLSIDINASDDDRHSETQKAKKSKRTVSTSSTKKATRGKKAKPDPEPDAEEQQEPEQEEGLRQDEEQDAVQGPKAPAPATRSRKPSVKVSKKESEQDEPESEGGSEGTEAIGKGRPTGVRPTRQASRAASNKIKEARVAEQVQAAKDAAKDAALVNQANEAEAAEVGRKASRGRTRKKKTETANEGDDGQPPLSEPASAVDVPASEAAQLQADAKEDDVADSTVIEHPPSEASDVDDPAETEEPEVVSEQMVTKAKAKSSRTRAQKEQPAGNDTEIQGKTQRKSSKRTTRTTASAENDRDESADELDLISDPPQTGASDLDADNTRSSSPVRSPLTQLKLLNNLQISDKERSMTLGQWLQYKADEAASEMKVQGEVQIQDLQKRMAEGRQTIEKTLLNRTQ